VLSFTTLGALVAPGQEHLSAPGAMNVGHETLACDSCHEPAAGTVRQQVQANARFALGLRKSPVDFGNADVENEDCIACHERPFDRHPVFRFNEPRFEEARAKLAPHQCQSCHREHSGAKVVVEATYCETCHSDLKLEDDPIDMPHETLVEDQRWDTCLGCHDFHGNHRFETPTKLRQAVPKWRIEAYFAGKASPYGKELLAPAKKKRGN